VKLALIAPNKHLDLLPSTGYHLLLPQNVNAEGYQEYYRRRRTAGDFLILDNGAAEGLWLEQNRLYVRARHMMVNEIVVHDEMGNYRGTIKRVEQWAKELDPAFGYMGAVQGQSLDECKKCIDWYLEETSWISTLGIPRHLITTTKTKDIRLLLAHYIRSVDKSVTRQIHLLGTSPDYIEELADLGAYFNAFNVRGIDTSAPYSYALLDRYLQGTVVRPKGYFTRRIANLQQLRTNIFVLKAWCDNTEVNRKWRPSG
jgi:hypothetical protein